MFGIFGAVFWYLLTSYGRMYFVAFYCLVCKRTGREPKRSHRVYNGVLCGVLRMVVVTELFMLTYAVSTLLNHFVHCCSLSEIPPCHAEHTEQTPYTEHTEHTPCHTEHTLLVILNTLSILLVILSILLVILSTLSILIVILSILIILLVILSILSY